MPTSLRISPISRLAAAALILSPVAASSDAAPQAARSAITVDTCPPHFPANWRCLRVAVPVEYAEPNGPTTDVRVVVAPAQQPKPKPEAVILVQGGPGGSGTAVAGSGFIGSIGALQATHDLVVVDQRQVSGPNALVCPPSGPLEKMASWGEDLFSSTHLQSCLARSAAKASLKALTTTVFARDIESVRAALGYDGVKFYSGNYGGRIVQEYIRRFPGRVRAAVLADSGPMDEPEAWSGDRWTVRAIRATLAACHSDPQCHKAFPKAEDEFDALMARSGARGLAVTIAGTHGPATVVFDQETVLAFFRSHFHFMRDVVAIPYEIHELSSADPDRVAAVGRDILGYQQSTFHVIALGVWMSVQCAEEAPEMRARVARGEQPGSGRVLAILAACRTWPHAEPPADFNHPVHSDVPLLLLASPMEPSYPAELARPLAAGFSHVRIVVDVNHGHVFDDDWQMCLGPQAVAFLETLDLSAVDPRCAARFQFRPFKLR